MQVGLKSAVHPVQSTSLMTIYCGLKVKRVRMVAASVNRINAVSVYMDTKNDENEDCYNDL